MKEAVITIYYKDSLMKLHREPQGKFFYVAGKPYFLADMTPSKWWRNYAGYSIAKQLLEAFSKLKIRPVICYRVREKGILYFAKPSDFKKKGILVPYGHHQQYVLPIKNWTAREGRLDDPHNLPVVKLGDWVAGKDYVEPEYEFVGNTAVLKTPPRQEALL